MINKNLIKLNNLIFNFENKLELIKYDKSKFDLKKFDFLSNIKKYNILFIRYKKLNVEQFNHIGCTFGPQKFEVKHKYKLLRENEIDKIYIFEIIEMCKNNNKL